MAVIQRPAKEGAATTYQGKVAQGFTKILASEVDADLDTIYAAWNGGADAVNIASGSITSDKLAPGAVGTRELADGGVKTIDLGDLQVTTIKLADGAATGPKIASAPTGVDTANINNQAVGAAQLKDGAVTLAKLDPALATMGGDLSGSLPTPSVARIASGVLPLVPRAMLQTTASFVDFYANNGTSPNFDNTKPYWFLRLDYTGDKFEVWRAPPPGYTTTRLFYVGADGYTGCTLAPNTVTATQLAYGASVRSSVTTSPPGGFVTSGANWTRCMTFPNIVLHGGSYSMFMSATLTLNNTAPSTVYISFGRVGIGALANWQWQLGPAGPGLAYVPVPNVMYFGSGISGTTQFYIDVKTAAGQVGVMASDQGLAWVIEWS